MKVVNKGNLTVNVVLACGPVELKKGESVEMPEWVFKSLKPIFPALEAEKAVIVHSEPSVIEPAQKDVDAEPKVKKNAVKSKKSRK